MNTTYDPERNVVYVRSGKCETCIFTRNRPVSVERVRGMVRDADEANSCIPCHKHLYVGDEAQPVCRGYYDRHSSMTLRLAAAMNIIEFTTD